MSQTPALTPDETSDQPPNLDVDWEAYGAMLEESDLSEDQKHELLATLWSIVVMFVDLGFDLQPSHKSCGESDDPLSDHPPDLLSLLAKELEEQQDKEAPWQS